MLDVFAGLLFITMYKSL